MFRDLPVVTRGLINQAQSHEEKHGELANSQHAPDGSRSFIHVGDYRNDITCVISSRILVVVLNLV